MNEKLRAKYEEFLALLEGDADIVEYKEAKEAYLSDNVVVTKINEYNVQSSLLEQENAKEEKDTLLIESIKKRVDRLYTEITENKAMQRMTAAEEKMGMLFTEINSGLQTIINPESDSCGGSCSSCSGCH